MLDTIETNDEILGIERVLWQVTTISRKQYSLEMGMDWTLKLLLFKRISEGKHIEQKWQLIIPEGSRWSNLEEETEGLAEKLNNALSTLEKANPKLEGIFTNPETNIWAILDDGTLSKIFQLFSVLDLSNQDSTFEIGLGQASERLIEKVVFSNSRAGVGRNSTPQQISRLMVKLMSPQPGTSVYDPVCVSSEFLIAAARFMAKTQEDLSTLDLYGQSPSTQECAIAKINLLLNGVSNADIRQDDCLVEPRFTQGEELRQFDLVMANPPFGRLSEQLTSYISDYPPFNQFPYGIPRTSKEFLFIQHVLSSLKPTGKGIMVLPRGFLFRQGAEGKIRRGIIEAGWIEAIIALAPKLLYYSGIPVVVVVFNKRKAHRNDILFIDASAEYEQGGSLNVLQLEHISKITSTYHKLEEEEGFSKLVSVEEIAKNNFNLSIDQYVYQVGSSADQSIDIAQEISNLHVLEAQRTDLEEKIDTLLQSLGVKV